VGSPFVITFREDANEHGGIFIKKLLVTGADGFIGKHVLRKLTESQYEIHCLSRTPKAAAGPVIWNSFDLLQDDIGSLIKSIKPSHVLHLAWCTEHGQFWEDISNKEWLKKSKELLHHFCQNSGERFIFAGTCAEYAWNGDICVESVTPEFPKSLYGQSKLAFTKELQEAANKFGVSVAIGRIFSLYGPGEDDRRLIPSLIKNLTNGHSVEMSDGDQWRDYLFVEDVASAMVALLNSETSGIVNIASGVAVQLKTLANAVCELIGQSPDSIQLGKKARGADDVAKVLASTLRLNNEIKWHPKFDLQHGLRATLISAP
jgi:nucleoside-diphosphate-sugar epimerase